MKMYSREGNSLMHIKTLRRDGCNYLMKGKKMAAVTMSVYLRPEYLWQVKDHLSWQRSGTCSSLYSEVGGRAEGRGSENEVKGHVYTYSWSDNTGGVWLCECGFFAALGFLRRIIQ